MVPRTRNGRLQRWSDHQRHHQLGALCLAFSKYRTAMALVHLETNNRRLRGWSDHQRHHQLGALCLAFSKYRTAMALVHLETNNRRLRGWSDHQRHHQLGALCLAFSIYRLQTRGWIPMAVMIFYVAFNSLGHITTRYTPKTGEKFPSHYEEFQGVFQLQKHCRQPYTAPHIYI